MILRYLFLFFLPLAALPAGCHDSHDGKTQNTLSSFRFVVPYAFNADTAASLILQGGSNNFRANGTAGAYLTDWQRVKITCDYMNEDLKFRYCRGSKEKWIGQAAGALRYEYLLDDCFFKAVTLSGFYSRAQSGCFGKKTIDDDYALKRKIRGSNFWSASAGGIISPWDGGFLGLELNYGQLTYRNKLSGLGGRIVIDQYFNYALHLHAEGEWQRFSKAVEGKIAKTFCWYLGTWDFGVFASRLFGEHGLSNNTRYGIEIVFGFQDVGAAESYYIEDPCGSRTPCDLIGWISQAAIEMPAIYSIAEQKILLNSPL